MKCEICHRDGAKPHEDMTLCPCCIKEFDEALAQVKARTQKLIDGIREAASLPAIPDEFSSQEQLDAWQPHAALERLRELNTPGITLERLAGIQQLRRYFNEKLNARN